MFKLEQKIIKWNESTFPHATEKAFLLKLKEELNEALSDIENENLAGLDYELADIAIVAISYLSRIKKKSFQIMIREKFGIVQGREFGEEDENGDRCKL